MNILIRTTIYLIILLIVICVIRIYKKRKSIKVNIIVIIMCIIISSLFLLLSYMNKFFVYKTPEELFNHSQKGQIETIVHGDNSCMVCYKNQRNIYSHTFLIKSSMGYKLLDTSDYIKVFDKFDSHGRIEIFMLKDTDDYYLLATIDSETENIRVGYDDNLETYDSTEICIDVIQIDETNFFCGFIDDFSKDTILCLHQSGDG